MYIKAIGNWEYGAFGLSLTLSSYTTSYSSTLIRLRPLDAPPVPVPCGVFGLTLLFDSYGT